MLVLSNCHSIVVLMLSNCHSTAVLMFSNCHSTEVLVLSDGHSTAVLVLSHPHFLMGSRAQESDVKTALGVNAGKNGVTLFPWQPCRAPRIKRSMESVDYAIICDFSHPLSVLEYIREDDGGTLLLS